MLHQPSGFKRRSLLNRPAAWWDFSLAGTVSATNTVSDPVGGCDMAPGGGSTLLTTTINGRPASATNGGANDRWVSQRTSPILNTFRFGIMVAWQVTPDNGTQVIWDTYDGSTANRYHAYDDGTNWVLYGTTSGTTLGTSDNNPHILYYEINGSACKFYVDGVLINTVNPNTPTAVSNILTLMNVGGGGLSGTSGRNRLGEAAVFTALQTPSAVMAESKRWMARWGIA